MQTTVASDSLPSGLINLLNHPPEFLLDAIDSAIAQSNLYDFVQQAWPIAFPGVSFIHSKQLEAICLHLQAIQQGLFKRLLINIPPRTGKTLSTEVFFPAYIWANDPGFSNLMVSYDDSIPIDAAVNCRNIIESDWYQQRWRINLATDHNTKSSFKNTKGGKIDTTSFGGASTGKGGNGLTVDDPHKLKDAFYPDAITRAVTYFRDTLLSRLNSSDAWIVVMMQRVHVDDLSAYALKQGGWVHLCLPMEYEPDRHCVTPIWEDWRKEPGELLCPELISPARVQELKDSMTSVGWATQYQQRPTVRGGSIFKREWFTRFIDRDKLPQGVFYVRFWDMAATEEKPGRDPDWTVGAKVGLYRNSGKVFTIIADIQRFRRSPAENERRVRQVAEMDGRGVPVFMEQEPGSSGKTVISHYKRNILNGWSFHGIPSTGDKTLNAELLAAAAEHGRVVLVRAEWNEAFLAEAEQFPNGSHDDQVDAVSHAYNNLTKPRSRILS